MNLPAINIKMKNQNQLKQEPTQAADGFGLGIQVFKIQSAKNMSADFKSKNRNAIKNIENPMQPTIFKPSIIPKPKKLPTIQKSQSEINSKQRMTAFISSKIQSVPQNGSTNKLIQKKQPSADTIVTPVSYSMRKKVGVSTQKNILTNQTGNQTAKPFHVKNIAHDKQQVASKSKTIKVNQMAPPQMMYKPQQQYYVSYHSEHEVLNRFYIQLQNFQKQNLKQINRIKKTKDFQMDSEAYDRMDYLQSLEVKIENVIDNIEKQQFQESGKQSAKNDDKKLKKMVNTIVPISGFKLSQFQTYDFDSIEKYQLADYSGFFKLNNYENIDLAPTILQLKNDQQ